MTKNLKNVGQLARVTAIDDFDNRVCIDLRNGASGWIDQEDHPWQVGDVLLIIGDEDDRRVERMPKSMWPDELWVGVVKIKLPDVTIVDAAGRFRTVPTTTQAHYEVGNTVQVREFEGVTRVLSEDPIKYIDLPAVDDAVIRNFLWSPPDTKRLDFEDFGGLPRVVDRARELIEVPLKNHEKLLKIGARPIKGVLFTGAPGTGKTMLARIIASQCEATFYEISGPEIFSKWYGQSEELLRKLFQAAAKEDKAIIFFDEIDSIAAQRDDESHEASKRVVAQLLSLMDGFKSDSNVIVIAATNRPQDLDVALRRPGRFDWNIEFPYPDEDDREDILRKTARQLQTRDPLPHETIANSSSGWSGAELAAIWSEAALLAVEDKRSEIFEEDYIGGFERVSYYRRRAREVGGGCNR